ncbi:hypothetical protein RRG08_065645 [Elysia crispata]|uniref:Uncharacterized protein n=1 Tax=Elysia crispata TaxID=231223 RepID=A0AAE0YN12_9GAST|nr:hypothetical protein RRG08_065645 [Elysia crispata]
MREAETRHGVTVIRQSLANLFQTRACSKLKWHNIDSSTKGADGAGSKHLQQQQVNPSADHSHQTRSSSRLSAALTAIFSSVGETRYYHRVQEASRLSTRLLSEPSWIYLSTALRSVECGVWPTG